MNATIQHSRSFRIGIRSRSCWAFILGLVLVPAAARSTAAEIPLARHFLWRVSNRTTPFYILGSLHALRASDYPLGAAIDNAVDQCQSFVFEYDDYHTDAEVWRAKMRAVEHYPAGVTLRQRVRPETYAYVQKIAKVRASEYDDTKPWAIACFMMRHPSYHQVHAYYGVENYITRRQPFANFSGLETLDEHVHVLADMSDRESELFLLQTFVYSDRREVGMNNLIAAYKLGDGRGLVAQDAQENREAPFLTRRLIERRNAIWVPRIQHEMQSGLPTMIVVGARHLCGRNNLIALLKARGYKLEQL